MSKFKAGDYVVRKSQSNEIHRVEKSEVFVHEAFTYKYFKLEGMDAPQNEEDYMLVGSFEESIAYAMAGIFWTISGCVGFIFVLLVIYKAYLFLK